MSNSEKVKILMNEYIKNYRKILYLPMKVTGFVRYDIKNNEIVELLRSTLLYRTVLFIVTNMEVAYLVYSSLMHKSYFEKPDGMALFTFSLFANMLLINQTFVNRNSGLLLLNQTFKIDAHLGIKETEYLREVEVKTFLMLSVGVAVFSVVINVFLYMQYEVPLLIQMVGLSYFFWLAFCYNDYVFFCLHCTFIALRARFLNVALAKIGGVKIQYLSDNSVLNIFLWKKSYNELVDFNGNYDDYRIGFELIFNLLRIEEKLYSFPIAVGFSTIVIGTFVASQTYIERLKTGVKLDQEGLITSWALLSWGFMILVAVFLDLFQQQIEQTKLICACIQLKPNKPEVYKLSKNILRMLERRKTRLAVYNMYYFDTGVILRMASATLVYITVQLQLAFPKRPYDATSRYNGTDGF